MIYLVEVIIMLEIWRPIDGYTGLYEVSSLGKIRSLLRKKDNNHGRLLSPSPNTDGYLTVVLTKDSQRKSFKVHRLVAQAFIPNPNSYPQVNHKDENKSNNQVTNLEWCTAKYNNNYGGRISRASKNIQKASFGRKLSEETKDKIRKAHLGKKLSKSSIRKRTTKVIKPVVQLTSNNSFVKKYDRVTSVSDYGFDYTDVLRCCRGTRKTHKGFHWMYLKDYEKRAIDLDK